MNTGLRFSNISSRDSHNKDNPRFNIQDNNLRGEFTSRKNKSKDLRLSNHRDNARVRSQGNNIRSE
jgi:hypothetical protein